MTNKVKLTKDSLVKDILNFNCTDSTPASRDELAAKLSAWGMSVLAKKYNVDLPLKINDDVNNRSHQRAVYKKAERTINLSTTKFAEQDQVGEDIISILHEVKHYADSTGRVADGKVPVAGLSPDDEEFRKYMTDMYAIYHKPAKKSFKDYIMGKKTGELTPEIFYEKFKYYQYAKYWMQPAEVNARQFSYDALKELIDAAKSVDNLSPNEQTNLANLEAAYKRNLTAEIANERLCVSDIKVIDMPVMSLCEFIQKDALQPNANGQNILQFVVSANTFDQFVDNMDNTKFVLFNGMKTFDYLYDDERASKWFDVLLSAQNDQANGACMRMARTLINYSQFKPNDEQRAKLDERLDAYNKYVSSRLMYDKKIAKESFLVDEEHIRE